LLDSLLQEIIEGNDHFVVSDREKDDLGNLLSLFRRLANQWGVKCGANFRVAR